MEKTIEKCIDRCEGHVRKVIWAQKNYRNKGEENMMKTAVEKLARGLGEARKWVCRDKAGMQDTQRKDKGG